jgi:hypothetical protein
MRIARFIDLKNWAQTCTQRKYPKNFNVKTRIEGSPLKEEPTNTGINLILELV